MKTHTKSGLYAASTLLLLEICYITVLGIGLATLPSPDAPIQDPWFTMMELLILMIAPFLVLFFTILHYRTDPAKRIFSLASLLFMVGLCILTMGLHFSILVLSRQAVFSVPPWTDLVFPFQWPSAAYAIDILAWDVFWPLSLFLSAVTMIKNGLEGWIRIIFFVSALLAAFGLIGVVTGDMSYRNIGIIGYVPVFMIALVIWIRLFIKELRQAGNPHH